MNDKSSSNRRDFNYGVGRGNDPKPPAYLIGEFLSRQLGKEASVSSEAAWAHEMLLRDWRLAETDSEEARALQALHEANERVFSERREQARKRGANETGQKSPRSR